VLCCTDVMGSLSKKEIQCVCVYIESKNCIYMYEETERLLPVSDNL